MKLIVHLYVTILNLRHSMLSGVLVLELSEVLRC